MSRRKEKKKKEKEKGRFLIGFLSQATSLQANSTFRTARGEQGSSKKMLRSRRRADAKCLEFDGVVFRWRSSIWQLTFLLSVFVLFLLVLAPQGLLERRRRAACTPSERVNGNRRSLLACLALLSSGNVESVFFSLSLSLSSFFALSSSLRLSLHPLLKLFALLLYLQQQQWLSPSAPPPAPCSPWPPPPPRPRSPSPRPPRCGEGRRCARASSRARGQRDAGLVEFSSRAKFDPPPCLALCSRLLLLLTLTITLDPNSGPPLLLPAPPLFSSPTGLPRRQADGRRRRAPGPRCRAPRVRAGTLRETFDRRRGKEASVIASFASSLLLAKKKNDDAFFQVDETGSFYPRCAPRCALCSLISAARGRNASTRVPPSWN